MPINIKYAATDAKVRELAALTGESITDAVRIPIEQRLRRESPRHRAGVAARLLALGATLSARPRLLEADADATIGYDAFGAPK